MLHESLWRAHERPQFSSGPFPDEVDVAIIGGGITGLTAAWLLKRTGRRVAVFERERIGAGETGSTSAHLTCVTDMSLGTLADRFGRDAAREVWRGGAAAIDLIEMISSLEHIACGFQRVPGHTCSPFLSDGDDGKRLRDEASLAAQLGFDARYLARGPVTGKPAIEYPEQAIFHPLDYAIGLALAVNRDGSFVFEHAEVDAVMQDPMAITVNAETIACRDVFIATHVPIVGSTSLVSATAFQTKIYPYSTYVLGGDLNTDDIAPGLYSDTDDPYYYLRVHAGPRGPYGVFGGKDHKTGQEGDTDSPVLALSAAFHQLFRTVHVERRWSGQVIGTADGLPFIGETAPHQYAATGYSGNGLTFGTLAGMMVHDAIVGVRHPLAELLTPDRKASSAAAIVEYVSENVDYPYHLVADWIRHREGRKAESVAAGDGKVMSLDGKRVAVHRTADGQLLKVSAVCTHMACIVRWNGTEQTWDCPCHGSRFTPDGLVLGGPAEVPLAPVNHAQ